MADVTTSTTVDNFMQAADAAAARTTIGAAALASPTFTGTPAAPTAAGGTNTTQLATTAFVTAAVAGVVPGYTSAASFAALPSAAAHSGETYFVAAAQGVIWVNRKPAGLYTSDGAAWNYDADQTDAYLAASTPSAGQIPVGDGTNYKPQTLGGDATLAADGTLSIGSNKISNAKAGQMAANTVKVNATSGTANAADLAMGASTILARLASGDIVAATVAQIKTLLTYVVGDIPTAAPLASPTFTGTPAAPTAAVGTNSTQLATTAFVASAVSGTAYKEASKYSTTAALPTVVYANGSSGVGATLTAVGLGALSIDGQSPAAGDRLLVKNQATAAQNGIYLVTAAGSGAAVFVLTRATDFDESSDIEDGDTTYVINGTVNAGSSWVQVTTGTITIGTTSIVFSQVSGPGSLLAGTGISVSGLTVAIDTAVTVDKTTAQTLTNKSLDAGQLTGTIAAARMPALTGDVTTSAGAVATTLATVNSNVGAFTHSSVTVNAKGLVTAASSALMGFQPNAEQVGFQAASSYTTAITLAISGGSIEVPMVISGSMKIIGITYGNRDAASLHTLEWGIYTDPGSSPSNQVTGATGSFSFTPSASSIQSSTCSSPVTVGPGTYWVVLRNTSASVTAGVGSAAGGSFTGNTMATQTLGSSLASTLDLATGWSKSTSVVAIRIDGAIQGASSAY